MVAKILVWSNNGVFVVSWNQRHGSNSRSDASQGKKKNLQKERHVCQICDKSSHIKASCLLLRHSLLGKSPNSNVSKLSVISTISYIGETSSGSHKWLLDSNVSHQLTPKEINVPNLVLLKAL